MYKCKTQNGSMAYFNVPGAASDAEAGVATRGASTPSPPGFPKVEASTQKGRDAVRRKVLNEELAAEQRLLAEARAAYGSGAPPPSQEEQDVPQKYAERIAKMRQAVSLHERNIEALKKELAALK